MDAVNAGTIRIYPNEFPHFLWDDEKELVTNPDDRRFFDGFLRGRVLVRVRLDNVVEAWSANDIVGLPRHLQRAQFQSQRHEPQIHKGTEGAYPRATRTDSSNNCLCSDNGSLLSSPSERFTDNCLGMVHDVFD